MLLIAVLLVGLLLVTGKTAREFFSLIFSKTRKVAVPVGHAAKRKWDDLSTLNSEREGDDDWGDDDWGDDLSDEGLGRRRTRNSPPMLQIQGLTDPTDPTDRLNRRVTLLRRAPHFKPQNWLSGCPLNT